MENKTLRHIDPQDGTLTSRTLSRMGLDRVDPMTFIHSDAVTFLRMLTNQPIPVRFLIEEDFAGRTNLEVVWLDGNLAKDGSLPIAQRADLSKGILLDEAGHILYSKIKPSERENYYRKEKAIDTPVVPALFCTVSNLLEDHYNVRRLLRHYPGFTPLHYKVVEHYMDPAERVAKYKQARAEGKAPKLETLMVTLIVAVKGDVRLAGDALLNDLADQFDKVHNTTTERDRVDLAVRITDAIALMYLDELWQEPSQGQQPPSPQPSGEGQGQAAGDRPDANDAPDAGGEPNTDAEGNADGDVDSDADGDEPDTDADAGGDAEQTVGDLVDAEDETGEGNADADADSEGDGEDAVDDSIESSDADTSGAGEYRDRQDRAQDLEEQAAELDQDDTLSNAGVPEIQPTDDDPTREQEPVETVEKFDIYGQPVNLVRNPDPSSTWMRQYKADKRQDALQARQLARRLRLRMEDSGGYTHGYRSGTILPRDVVKVARGSRTPASRYESNEAPDLAVMVLQDTSASIDMQQHRTLSRIAQVIVDALEPIDGIHVWHASFAGRHGTTLRLCHEDGKSQRGHIMELCKPGGSTPTPVALAQAARTLNNQPTARKVVILLTDGEPDYMHGTSGNDYIHTWVQENTAIQVVQVVIGRSKGADIPNTVRIDELDNEAFRRVAEVTNKAIAKARKSSRAR